MSLWLGQLASIIKTRTAKDSLIVTLGMGLNTVLSAVSIFLIARFLGPSGFGIYATVLAMVVIVTDSLELAISGSIVKFASQENSQSLRFIKYGFFLKLVLGFVLGGLFWLVSQPVASLISSDLLKPLKLASFFIPVLFLSRFPRSLLQAKKQFFKDISLEVITSLFRLGALVSFYFLGWLTVTWALAAYLFGTVVAFLLGATLINWQFLSSTVNRQTKRHFFSFQKWLTVAYVIAAIHGRIDNPLILRLSGANTSGIYQAAYRFFMPAIQLSASLSLVFAPRFASFPDLATSRAYLKKASKLSLALGGLVLLIIPLSGFLVKLIFGSAYLTAVLPTQILAFGFAFFVAGSPFVAHLIYATNHTRAFFGVNLLQMILLISLDLLLVPSFGAVGAALATSLTLITVNLIMAVMALNFSKPS
jgi:O-antigen/teichoic acid export membrane protein